MTMTKQLDDGTDFSISTKATRELLKVLETPLNSIDEVMVAHKGTMASILRQYVAKKTDKWDYKFF